MRKLRENIRRYQDKQGPDGGLGGARLAKHHLRLIMKKAPDLAEKTKNWPYR